MKKGDPRRKTLDQHKLFMTASIAKSVMDNKYHIQIIWLARSISTTSTSYVLLTQGTLLFVFEIVVDGHLILGLYI